MNIVDSMASLRDSDALAVDATIHKFRHFGGVDPTYLDYNTLFGLLQTDLKTLNDLPPLRVAVLRNFTVEGLLPVLAGEIVRGGFSPKFYVGEFDSVATDVLNPDSALFRFQPDFVILAQWLEGLQPALVNRFLTLSSNQIEGALQDLRAQQSQLLSALREQTNAIILLNNFPLPAYPTLGILDARQSNGQTGTVLNLNSALAGDCQTLADTYVIDLMRLVGDIGYRNAVNARFWHAARAPLSPAALIAYGQECGRFFRALRGRSRKCLVLDCDNTLWGGVIGEDGMEGIKCDSTYPGSCYRALQEEALNLYHRGIILALCSKNNAPDVLAVLRDHPDMVLREEHFAITMINWDDKVTNLCRIAAELSIGLDSLVLMDDNPFETNFVAQHLPEVAVISLSGNLAEYRAALARSGLFDSVAFSDEDRNRTGLYRSNRQRKEIERSSGSLAKYLTDLAIRAEFGPPRRTEIARIAQLTQKTNQFNLTTRRYSEGEIDALASDAESQVTRLSASDKVSNLGLVGVAIVRYHDNVAEIETFLMSCRALGRGLEDGLLHIVADKARQRGASIVRGIFRQTKKNDLCIDFYQRNGFEKTQVVSGATIWELAADRALPQFPAWINRVSEADNVS
jgi:FkbH-like protein